MKNKKIEFSIPNMIIKWYFIIFVAVHIFRHIRLILAEPLRIQCLNPPSIENECLIQLNHRNVSANVSTDQYTIVRGNDIRLAQIPVDLFTYLPNVRYAYFLNCGLKTIDIYNTTNALKHMDLSSNFIQKLHNFTFSSTPQLEELILSYNKIKTIDRLAFYKLYNLTTLDLSFNEILSLDEDQFYPLVRLRYLNLYSNQLHEIISNTFQYNSGLSSIQLNYNQLKYIAEDAFINKSIPAFFDVSYNYDLHWSDLFSKMVYMANVSSEHIRINNEVSFVNASYNDIEWIDLTNAQQLISLHLSSNKLTDLRNISQANNLFTLDLSDNDFTEINENVFRGLYKISYLKLNAINVKVSIVENGLLNDLNNLKVLDLSNNNMDGKLDLLKLPKLTRLEELYLHGNQFKQFTRPSKIREQFPNLHIIGLSNNDWNCCYLANLIKYLDKYNFKIVQNGNDDSNETFSDNPINIRGIECTFEFDQHDNFTDGSILSTWTMLFSLIASIILLVICSCIYAIKVC